MSEAISLSEAHPRTHYPISPLHGEPVHALPSSPGARSVQPPADDYTRHFHPQIRTELWQQVQQEQEIMTRLQVQRQEHEYTVRQRHEQRQAEEASQQQVRLVEQQTRETVQRHEAGEWYSEGAAVSVEAQTPQAPPESTDVGGREPLPPERDAEVTLAPEAPQTATDSRVLAAEARVAGLGEMDRLGARIEGDLRELSLSPLPQSEPPLRHLFEAREVLEQIARQVQEREGDSGFAQRLHQHISGAQVGKLLGVEP